MGGQAGGPVGTLLEVAPLRCVGGEPSVPEFRDGVWSWMSLLTSLLECVLCNDQSCVEDKGFGGAFNYKMPTCHAVH